MDTEIVLDATEDDGNRKTKENETQQDEYDEDTATAWTRANLRELRFG